MNCRHCLKRSLSRLILLSVLLLAVQCYGLGLSQAEPRVKLGNLSIAPVSLGTLNHFDDGSKAATILRDAAPPFCMIDTAELYGKGKAEILLQEAAEEAGLVMGDTLFCATKFAPNFRRLDAQSVAKACRESCKRLGVDQIDLYQIHYAAGLVQLPFFPTLTDEAYWQGLVDCFESGLVKNVGVCNYGPTMIRQCHAFLQERGVPLVSNQINYNLMRWQEAAKTKLVCDELGVRILAYHPLGKGTLANQYDLSSVDTMPEVPKYYRMKRWLLGTEELRETLARIATNRGRSSSQIAIKWVMQQNAIPICGARNFEQAKDNMGVLDDWLLSVDELQELESASLSNIPRLTYLDREFKLV